MSMLVRNTVSEVGTELRSVVTLNHTESETSISLGAFKEINGISGIGASIGTSVRPPRIHIQAREDVYLGFVCSHEMYGVHLH